MTRHYPLKILISLIVVVGCTYGCYQRIVTIYGLPFFVSVAGAHSVVIRRLPFHPLPAGLQSKDKLDLRSMDMQSRYAVMPRHYFATGFGLPAETDYQFSVNRGNARAAVRITTIPIPASLLIRRLYRWISVVTFVLLSGMVLLVLWRGRGRAAAGFTLWSLGALCASALEIVPVDAFPATVFIVVSDICSLLSVLGLYCLVESTVGATLSSRARWWWRGLFIAVLATGTLTSQIIGPVLFVTMAWTGLVVRPLQVLWAITYLVPIMMLFLRYRSVGTTQSLKLKWMLWSGALWAFAVLVNYSQTTGIAIALIMGGFLYLLAMFGFLYAVLRYRAVDVSVFIDHTLVYGSVTALVVGILALTNSLVQHAALGTSASLLVQIVVPLSLGIVLGQVRNYADVFVERVFFRRKYLAGKAIRYFARHCEGYDRVADLLSATTQIIHAKLNAPDVAVYVRNDGDYGIASSAGEQHYPANLSGNDPAVAAMRAGAKNIDLSDLESALGNDGYVFPMGAQAVLVCANRPGEHYAADERKLLAYVARQVGVFLQTLRVQEKIARLEGKASLVDEIANGLLPVPQEVQDKARKLASFVATG
jgi:hypothetical protein